ncbi:MAG: hypothetical protein AB1706_10140 [Pseudomonadota bacterium]
MSVTKFTGTGFTSTALILDYLRNAGGQPLLTPNSFAIIHNPVRAKLNEVIDVINGVTPSPLFKVDNLTLNSNSIQSDTGTISLYDDNLGTTGNLYAYNGGSVYAQAGTNESFVRALMSSSIGDWGGLIVDQGVDYRTRITVQSSGAATGTTTIKYEKASDKSAGNGNFIFSGFSKIYPWITNTIDMGNSSYKWKDGHFAGNVYAGNFIAGGYTIADTNGYLYGNLYNVVRSSGATKGGMSYTVGSSTFSLYNATTSDELKFPDTGGWKFNNGSIDKLHNDGSGGFWYINAPVGSPIGLVSQEAGTDKAAFYSYSGGSYPGAKMINATNNRGFYILNDNTFRFDNGTSFLLEISETGAFTDLKADASNSLRHLLQTNGYVHSFGCTAAGYKAAINVFNSSDTLACVYGTEFDNIANKVNTKFGDIVANRGIFYDWNNQRVGILDDSPSYTLDVAGSGQFQGTDLRVGNGTSGNLSLFSGTGGSSSLYMYDTGSLAALLRYTKAANYSEFMNYAGGYYSYFRLHTSGRVSIGSTNTQVIEAISAGNIYLDAASSYFNYLRVGGSTKFYVGATETNVYAGNLKVNTGDLYMGTVQVLDSLGAVVVKECTSFATDLPNNSFGIDSGTGDLYFKDRNGNNHVVIDIA